MLTTVTTTTVTTVTMVTTTTTVAGMVGTLGVVGMLNLLGHLTLKELATAARGHRWLFLARNLSIVILPLLVVFGFLVYSRVLTALQP